MLLLYLLLYAYVAFLYLELHLSFIFIISYNIYTYKECLLDGVYVNLSLKHLQSKFESRQ